jgi:hypothetical protein
MDASKRSPVPQAPPPAGIPFNAAQSRHLAIALDRVDEALLQLVEEARLLEGEAVAMRVLRPQHHDVPAGVISQVARRAALLRTRLRDEIGLLELQPLPELASRRLATMLTSARVVLVDARSGEMEAYGVLHPQAPAALDRWLDDWEHALTVLLRMLDLEADDAAGL